ncbi:hypothetical protein AHAS_Ahas13G0245900 [Arachis hypogaea]
MMLFTCFISLFSPLLDSEPKKKEIANVKVKCIACASRIERVVKGVVSKKNVTHRRMTSKVDKPRMLILGGALEYRHSNCAFN